jgi:hypothetical protein
MGGVGEGVALRFSHSGLRGAGLGADDVDWDDCDCHGKREQLRNG